MPKDQKQTSHKGDNIVSANKKTEKSDSKWWSRNFGNGVRKGLTNEHRRNRSAQKKEAPDTSQDTLTLQQSTSTSPLPSVQSNIYPAKTSATKIQVDQKPRGSEIPPTRVLETDVEESISQTKAIQTLVDSSNSSTSIPEAEPLTSNAGVQVPMEGQVSQSKSKQRLAAEESFKTAVEKLHSLMLQIAGKGNQKFVIDVIKIDKFSDFGTNVKEIGSAIDAFMDKRTELRTQKSQITDIAEKWFKACFPFVKSGFNVASVFSRTKSQTYSF